MKFALIAYGNELWFSESNPGEATVASDVSIRNVYLFDSRAEAEKARREYLGSLPAYPGEETAVLPVDEWMRPCRNRDGRSRAFGPDGFGAFADDGR